MITPDREGAAYRQLAGVLRERIRSGELASGQRMQSEKDLHDEFGLALRCINCYQWLIVQWDEAYIQL